jgi:hypothetical protein
MVSRLTNDGTKKRGVTDINPSPTTLPTVVVSLNTQPTQGMFINGKMDDNNVSMTIMGYYIDA